MQPILRLTLPLAVLMLGGCAAVPPAAKRDPRDPWERFNRATYAFNDTLDRKVATPVAKGYRAVTPGFVRTGVSNFFANLNSTTTIANDLLQARIKYFFSDTGRFVMNSTLGIAGFLDPASSAGLQQHYNDFGQTLARYGAGPGPFIMLPLVGPSTVRDGIGLGADRFTKVATYVLDTGPAIGEFVAEAVDLRYRLLGTNALIDQSYDRYAFVRNAYLQNREFVIHGSKPTTDDDENEKLLEELDKEDATAPKQPAKPPARTRPPQQTRPQQQPQTPPQAPRQAPPQSPAPQSQAPQQAPQEPPPQ